MKIAPSQIEILHINVNDPDLIAGWREMRGQFMPETTQLRHRQHCTKVLASPERFAAFVAKNDTHNQLLGFAEASIRQDYVNGCNTEHVCFLELLFVLDEYRRQGIAKLLIRSVEQWGQEMGCHEFAVDTFLDDESSQQVYRAYGFSETERTVYFKKSLSPKVGMR